MQLKNLFILLAFTSVLFASCEIRKKQPSTSQGLIDLKEIIASDTLRVATMYGSTSYFLFRDELMGFDYEMVEDLAKHLKVKLKISIAKNDEEIAQWLLERKVDLVAYNFIETKGLKSHFHFVFPQPESYQVLVQNMGSKALSDVTELSGKTVHVKANTIFHQRLLSLNEEIGGTIQIVTVPDSVSNDELIDQVAENKIEFTLAYHNTALLHKSYHKRLDIRMPVGFQQQNGWLIRQESIEFKQAIENWTKMPETEVIQARLFSKYWKKSPYFASRKVKIPKGAISPYDDLFKKYATLIDWDWRLLAAVAFHESRFDATEVSWAGACGIMQLMPRTAANFGLDNTTILDPEMNIEAGVQYIKSLNMTFRKVENKDERIKFILAGYNSGPAHILDAMALTEKYGKDPHIWFNQVEYFLLKKSEPEFYNDPVVKYGSFRGKETVRYVLNTLDTYEKYLKRK